MNDCARTPSSTSPGAERSAQLLGLARARVAGSNDERRLEQVVYCQDRLAAELTGRAGGDVPEAAKSFVDALPGVREQTADDAIEPV